VALVVTVGVGMAAPYLLLSAFPELARRFPRTGPWSELIKQLMGFLLLGVAVYFARPFYERYAGTTAFWWAMMGIVGAAAIFLVVRTMMLTGRLSGRLAAVAVAVLMIAPVLGLTLRLTNPPLAWQEYTPEALAEARASGRTVLVEFTATWCTNCQALEATVFHDPAVVQAIRQHNVLALRADVTYDDAPGWKLLGKASGAGGAIPLTEIYSPRLTSPIRMSGIYRSADLLAAIAKAMAPLEVATEGR